MHKKGVSNVVATILLILITIVAVFLLWSLIKFFNFRFDFADLTILDEGFTMYNPIEKIAMVQVERGKDDATLSGLEVIFSVGGNSYVYQTPSAPNLNEKRVYYFNLCKDGIGFPEKISVAPIFSYDSQEHSGEIISKITKINVKNFSITPSMYEDSAKNRWRRSQVIPPDFPSFLKTSRVSHWKFNYDISDELGINDLTSYGGDNVTYAESGVGCGSSINFGNGGFASNNETRNNGIKQEEGTVSVWFKREGYNGGLGIGRNYIFSMFNWSCHFYNDYPYCDEDEESIINRIYIYFNANDDNIGYVVGPVGWNIVAEVPLNEWNLATLTWESGPSDINSGIARFYLNGNFMTSSTYTDLTITDQVRWGSWPDLPGSDSSGSSLKVTVYPPAPLTYLPYDEMTARGAREYFNGSLDEAKIFDRALNDWEIQMLYVWESYLRV
ncbi:MAG: archaellin/type IV pilin N-terminal domain-containing protein [Candidatus Pacearchaeota archaeon]